MASRTLVRGRVIRIGTPVRGRGIGIGRASTTTSSPARRIGRGEVIQQFKHQEVTGV